MRYYRKDASLLCFSAPSTKFSVLGACIFICSCIMKFLANVLKQMPQNQFVKPSTIDAVILKTNILVKIGFVSTCVLLLISVLLRFTMSDSYKIKMMVCKGLFCYEYGNPLNLKEFERLPKVICKKTRLGIYELTITATCVTVDDISKLSSSVSSSLNRKSFEKYAVTQSSTDLAFNNVTFIIEDVTIDRSLIFESVDEMKPKNNTQLQIQKDVVIDLTTSGSMLIAGKTRSGKTTSIISLLLQALMMHRDEHDSLITIIDPKHAELSRLPYVYSVDDDGEATNILNAVQKFADLVTKRQKILNELSEKSGDAVKWWDAGLHVSILFIDEYVACRTMFPKKSAKDNSNYNYNYNITTFDALIKRIITMGASAGCYMILSIAEASVEEGGLPSMLRSAMSTRVLFKPTLPEARLLWDSEKLKEFSNGRVYNAGDAWFSSTDGIHDCVSYVHFPVMRFAVYQELGHLLELYYGGK